MLGTAAPKIIRGNMDLPDGARRTGRFDHLGHEILVEDEPIFEKRQAEDAAGEPIFKLNRHNERVAKVMVTEQVGVKEREFILDDLGNGIVTKNYDFQPDPEESLRAAARQAHDPLEMDRRLARIEAALAATGLTVADAEQLADTYERREQATEASAGRQAEIEERRRLRQSETPEQRAARLQAKAERRAARGPRQPRQ